jgi:hypothetical protein
MLRLLDNVSLIKEGQVCPKCGKGTMRRFNSPNWGQTVDANGKIGANISEFKCSNPDCGYDQANIRLSDGVDISD